MPIQPGPAPLDLWDTAYAHWDRTALEDGRAADAPVSLLVRLLPEGKGQKAGDQARALKALIEGAGPITAQDGERERLAWLIAVGDAAREAEVFIRVPENELDAVFAAHPNLFVPVERMAQAGCDPRWAPAGHVADPLIDATSAAAKSLRADIGAGKLPPGASLKRQPIMAVIDGDIAYLNARFTAHTQAGGRESRIQRIWLQGIAEEDRQAHVYDQVYTKADLDAALAKLTAGTATEPGLYAQMRPISQTGAGRAYAHAAGHGTHVMDLAAGADPATAPDLPIFAVQLASAALADPSSRRLDGSLVQGIRWLIRSALAHVAAANRAALTALGKGQPAEFLVPDIVLNCSIGTLAGPKNGQGLVERLVADELALVNDLQVGTEPLLGQDYRATLFQSFGNSYRTEQVALAKGVAGAAPVLDWRLPRDDYKSSVLEIRLPNADLAQLTLTGPDGAQHLVPAPAEAHWTDITAEGAPVMRLYRGRDEADGRRVYRLFVRPTTRPSRPAFVRAAPGLYRVAVKTKAATDVAFVVQRDDTPFGFRNLGGQSTLADASYREWEPSRRAYSDPSDSSILTREGTDTAEPPTENPAVITVGATVASTGGPAPYTSAGSTHTALTSRPGPVASARGDDTPVVTGLMASGTFSGSALRLQGTSVACPLAARAMAATGQRPLPPNPRDLRLGTLSEDTSGIRDTRAW